MIKVQISDTEFRWLNPLRILAIKPWVHYKSIYISDAPYKPSDGRGTVFTAGMSASDDHSTPPASTLVYHGSAEPQPDFYNIKETPEQVAEQMRALMPLITPHPKIPPGGISQ